MTEQQTPPPHEAFISMLRDKIEEAVSELKILEDGGVGDVVVSIIIGGSFLPKVMRVLDDVCSAAILAHGGLVTGLVFISHTPSDKFRVEEACRDFMRVLLELAPYMVPRGDEKLPCLALSIVLGEDRPDIVKYMQERGFEVRKISTHEGSCYLMFKNIVGRLKLGIDAVIGDIREIVQRFTTLKAK